MSFTSHRSILITRRCVWGIACLLLAGCSGSTASSSPTGSTAVSPTSNVQEVDVGGLRLDIECEGEGSPTVVFESGAGGDRFALTQWVDLRDVTRVCAYDRAGIGTSDERPATGSTSLGDLAEELARMLEEAGIEEPFVLASHSLGGGVAQFYVDRYPPVSPASCSSTLSRSRATWTGSDRMSRTAPAGPST